MPYVPADNGYERHVIALNEATKLVRLLPPGAVWSIFASNEDTHMSPAVLNVYVPDTEQRLRIRALLGFGPPDYDGRSTDTDWAFESHIMSELLLVSIEENKQ